MSYTKPSEKLPATLGLLRASRWGTPPLLGRSVRAEVRANLLAALRRPGPLFPGIHGYEDTIVPQLVNALLSRQDFILLGLRGQAKSRILRSLTQFLDPWLPIIAGSEVNDDPFAPLSKFGRERIESEGDGTPIGWVHREDRYVEKLATPDVTIADLIGDLDPIRAARGGHVLSDELTMHFGLLPRANRGVFAINELPDLAGKIQVGLFNIMQEGDVQLKGYPVRLPLDVLLCFTANPEDYTARGKIITPLKDRIGAEITTHYPRDVELGMAITEQEAWTARDGEAPPVRIPALVREVVERVAFEARGDKRVDRRSGVSQRLPISTLENVVSSAERRAVAQGEQEAVGRIADIYAALPSITGKLELEYEGELQGADTIAKELIRRAALRTFLDRFGDEADERLDRIVAWFDQGSALKVGGDERATNAVKAFGVVPGLLQLVHDLGLAPVKDAGAEVAGCELVLEALTALKRITRSEDYGYAAVRGKR
ncbi:MAG TPA: magnesium chelatase [Gemmatimonadales bacterium]|jgi:magnesium chelatase subunit I|nr:magnesium chelatase [Gemmatimonadales bacterium]